MVWHQYAQDFTYRALIRRSLLTSLPLYLVCVFIFHSPWFGIVRVERVRQTLFFCCAVACGVYAVQLSNDNAYLAVMKKAPPTGTLWVWAVMEMGPTGGAVSLLMVAAWVAYSGAAVM